MCEIVNECRVASNQQALADVNENLLLCSECDYECRNKDILINHLKSHNVYACDKCEFRGTASKGLGAHNKLHKRKQFKCTICEYTANTYSKLNIHMRSHSGEVITAESLLELVQSRSSDKSPLAQNKGKRNLSVSPEANTDNKLTCNGNNNKKTKK